MSQQPTWHTGTAQTWSGGRNAMLTHRRRFRIEWGDCDAAGVVFYPRYLAYFDACTHALFEYAGCRQREMQEKYQILGFPLVDVHARFITASSYDDDVMVESCVTEFGRTSFQVRHRLYKDAVLAVEGVEKRVCVAWSNGNPRKLEPRPLPPELVSKLTGNDGLL